MTIRGHVIYFFVTVLFMLSGPLYAEEENMEAAMAESLLRKAIETINRNGPVEAFYKFNTKREEFCYGEIYVWVVSMDGVIFAHCADPTMVGLDIMQAQDGAVTQEEKSAASNLINYALKEREGVLEYDWWNPVNSLLEKKHAYFKTVSPDNFRVDFIVLTGYYTSKQ